MRSVLYQKILPGGLQFSLVQGDLTEEKADVIVNAANDRLLHGGGLAGSIVRKGGMEIQTESDAWVQTYGPVRHDTPAITGPGKLPCRAILHAVGPVWGEGEEDAKLAAAVWGSLRAADLREDVSIGLSAISTGIFGFPKDRAARILLETIEEYASSRQVASLADVRVVIFDDATVTVFLEECQRRWK